MLFALPHWRGQRSWSPSALEEGLHGTPVLPDFDSEPRRERLTSPSSLKASWSRFFFKSDNYLHWRKLWERWE